MPAGVAHIAGHRDHPGPWRAGAAVEIRSGHYPRTQPALDITRRAMCLIPGGKLADIMNCRTPRAAANVARPRNCRFCNAICADTGWTASIFNTSSRSVQVSSPQAESNPGDVRRWYRTAHRPPPHAPVFQCPHRQDGLSAFCSHIFRSTRRLTSAWSVTDLRSVSSAAGAQRDAGRGIQLFWSYRRRRAGSTMLASPRGQAEADPGHTGLPVRPAKPGVPLAEPGPPGTAQNLTERTRHP